LRGCGFAVGIWALDCAGIKEASKGMNGLGHKVQRGQHLKSAFFGAWERVVCIDGLVWVCFGVQDGLAGWANAPGGWDNKQEFQRNKI
jgi:hypothetical protein